MTKTATIDIPRWEGTVEFLDPIPLPLVLDIDDALEVLNVARQDGEPVRISGAALVRGMLRPCLACAVRWSAKDMPEKITFDDFPGSPKGDSMRLALWVVGEVMAIYNGEAGGLNPTKPGQSSDG